MFNHLSQISNRYLGNTMTVRYWENARPQSEWLNHFQVKPSAQIQFVGTHKGYLDVSQLRLAQEWVNRFIKVCSQIIQDYPKMIDRKQFVFNLSLLSSDPTQTESDDSDESILTFSSSNEDTIGLF